MQELETVGCKQFAHLNQSSHSVTNNKITKVSVP